MFKKGYKRTPETIEKWKKLHTERIARLGYRYTDEQKKKISETCKARGVRPPHNPGRKHTEETKSKMSASRKGVNNLIGYKQTSEHRARRIEKISGQNNYKWIADRSKLVKKQERGDSAYREWRKSVWQRDGWKCRIENSECLGKIVAHHILPWSKFPDLRYGINNGITLCRFHHPLKRADEAKLSPFFQGLVSAKTNIF